MRSRHRLIQLLILLALVCSARFAGGVLWAQEKKQTAPDPFTVRMTAVVVNKEGAPVKKTRVWVYPLNAKGEAMIIRTMPPGYVVKVWNPVTETDATGKFTLEMPLATHIDGDLITAAVIGMGNPEGGMSLRSEKGLEYADPNRQKEDCLTMSVETNKLRLLRKGPEILNVKLAEKKGAQVDLGNVVVD